MSGQDAYRTVLARGSEQFIIHKSRFIGHGAPVRSEEEALDFLADVRRTHKDASHNCYAYVIGRNAGIARYSDDGEPSGTAGAPIIEVIKARGVVDVCVVVTRYFGGILLGAGGLIRAYAQGSKAALERRARGRDAQDAPLSLRRGLRHGGQARLLFESFWRVRANARDFAASVTYDVSVKQEDAPAFLAGLVEASLGRVEPLLLEEGATAPGTRRTLPQRGQRRSDNGTDAAQRDLGPHGSAARHDAVLQRGPQCADARHRRLADMGVNFTRAVSGYPALLPVPRVHADQPDYPHECVPGHEYQMPPEMPTVADVFNENGYQTAYFGKWHLDGFHEREGRAALHTVPPERRGHFQQRGWGMRTTTASTTAGSTAGRARRPFAAGCRDTRRIA